MNRGSFSLAEHRWTLSMLLFLVLLVSAPSLVFPFGRDQGSYAYTASRVLNGDAMYSETYAFKPPGTIFVHMISQILFGHNMLAIRILDLLHMILSSLLLYIFTVELFKNKWAALLCVLLFARMYIRTGYWHTAQTDDWSILPTAAAMLLALHLWKRNTPSFSLHDALLAGAAAFLVGLSFLLKYTLGIFLVVLVASETIRLRASKSTWLKNLLAMGIGFLAPILATVLYLYATHSLYAFWQIQLHNVFGYTEANREPSWWSHVYQYVTLTLDLLPVGFPLALLGLVFLYIPKFGKHLDPAYRAQVFLLAGWMAGAMASDYAQGKFFVYHTIPLFPPVAMLSVASIFLPGRILLWKLSSGVQKAIILPLALGLLLTFPPQLSLFAQTANIVLGRSSLMSYWMSGRFEVSQMSTHYNLVLANYILQNTRPDDTVFIWGQEPMVNFLTKRSTGSRYPYHHPIVSSWLPDTDRREFLQSIKKVPPRLFVISSDDAMPWSNGVFADSFEMLKRHRAIHDFVNKHYSLVARIGPFYVLRKHEVLQTTGHLSDDTDGRGLSGGFPAGYRERELSP